VKLMPLLATPPAVITIFPVVAPVGTGTTMFVALQPIGVAVVPLNVTVPIEVPKFVPVIVTEAPTGPDVGLRLVMLGADAALLTLTVTAALAVAFPEVSVATAVKV